MDPTLRIFVDCRRPTVAVVGELDVCSVTIFDEHVESLRGAVAAVDARYVTFIDAAGIAALVRLGDRRPLSVVASPSLARLIRVCELESHLVPTAPATPPRTLDEAPFAVLEIADDDSISYANGFVADHVRLPAGALLSQRWSGVRAFGGLRRGIDEARRSVGPAIASTSTAGWGPGPAVAMCWTLWPVDRASGSRAVVAIGAPA